MMQMTDAEFEALVGEVFDALPDEIAGHLDNVAFLIQDQAATERPRLFGLYSGRPLTTRGVYGFGELPDRITLFRNNLEASCSSVDELRARVRVTLVHEIGHYYGLDDAKLQELGWA